MIKTDFKEIIEKWQDCSDLEGIYNLREELIEIVDNPESSISEVNNAEWYISRVQHRILYLEGLGMALDEVGQDSDNDDEDEDEED